MSESPSSFLDRPAEGSLPTDPESSAANAGVCVQTNQGVSAEWNQTARDYPQDKCVHHLFEEQVERTPEAVAVVFEDQAMTYRELNARANRLAHHLRSLGVGPEVLVGLCVERSLEMVVALLGILKAGGAYVPLDPGYPAERLDFILKDCRTGVIVTEPSLTDFFRNLNSLCSLVMTGGGSGSNQCNLLGNSGSTALAYVIYTSGSTGTPKGVAIEHRNVVSFLHWVRETFTDEELSGVLAVTSVCFDISVFEIFGPLSWGGKIILAKNALHGVSDQDWSGVRLINTVPSLMETWLRTRLPPPSILAINLAGEFSKPSLVDAIYRQWPVQRVNDLYGPTETTIYSTWTTRGPGKPASIGRPISNTQVYILDANLHPVPVGEAGDLYISGAGVARGYLHRPELTAEKFIRHPFVPDPGARLYQTGDLARISSDGNLEYLGRVDQQVKLRGFRIELGEIESVLESHPQLRAAAVTVCRAVPEDPSLTAFLVLEEGTTLGSGVLHIWLQQRLPDYMIPYKFVELPVLPLNLNGKVDRKALETQDAVGLASETAYAAPVSELESMLVETWQTVLRRERVGIHDNFFHLGGHSLLAVAICSRIRQSLEMEVPLRWIFDHPTVASLANQMGSLTKQTGGNGRSEKIEHQHAAPMSFAQQGMWLMHQTLPDQAAYNQPIAFRLSGRVDQARARRALEVIVERHEILRTALLLEADALIQRVFEATAISFPWEEIDLRSLTLEAQRPALEEHLLNEARRPFDLSQAPLWRAVWIQMADDEQVLAMTFHHSIVDEWSQRLLVLEWGRLYQADGRVEGADLPELPVQYTDYAVEQRLDLTEDLRDRHRAYWSEALLDLPPSLELPCQRIRPNKRSGRGAVHGFQLTGPILTRIRETARAEGTTLFTVMLAAFQCWLHRSTGQTDIVVGTPITHRTRPELQSLLGFFLNTLPVRLQVSDHFTFRKVVREMRETLLDAFSHADLPFEQIVALSVKERTSTHHPIFQMMFVLLEEGLPALRFGGLQSERITMETQTSKSDLMLSIDAVGETWDCRFECASDLFTEMTVAGLPRHFQDFLEEMTAHLDEPVGQLRLLRPEERRQILVEWNQTARDYPRDQCVHHLFEEQVRERPEAVALELGEEQMTYGELSQASDHIAQHLCLRGVKAGEVVGLSVERSFERVGALLGILKVGAIYWALEENLPEARLRWLIEDAHPILILCGRNTAGNFSGQQSVCSVEDLIKAPREASAFIPIRTNAEDPAYISYTSGSTGQPKGVVVPHRGVVRLVKGADYVSLTPQETLLHMSPLSFDASTFELWGALLSGGRVVLMPPGQPSLAEIGSVIRHHGITTLWLTAGLFHLMVDERLDDLTPLRQLLAGGDVLSPRHVAKARRALPACTIVNGYGPTENTTFTCCYTVTADTESMTTVPIGRPIANTRVYILDANLQPVPVGVAGELFAGGDGVACGYLNQPELTEERFIPDPFSLKPGERLYRTGDRVRWREDGNIEFLGRVDHQVKVRGFRVEMGEIESALRAIPGVREAVVVQREGPGTERAVVAYLVGVAKAPLDPDDVRRQLRNQLPEYMIPSAFVILDQLPLLPNGKLDRRNLPVPEPTSDPATAEFGQARDLLELRLIRIWERLFQRTGIGRDDNFFELGGHSLMAARFAAELEKLLGCQLSIASLFQAPTIATLARFLTDESWAPPWSSLVELQPRGSNPPFFLAHGVGGQAYWGIHLAKRLGTNQPVYGIQAVGLDGGKPRHTTIESMAAHYVQEIRSLQPDGPYYLGGYSLGGLIAYEMAQQLHRQGQRVAVLALLDSVPTGPIPYFFYCFELMTYLPQRFLIHFRRFWNMPRIERYKYFRDRWVALQNRMMMNSAKKNFVILPDQETSGPGQELGANDYFHAVSFAYRLSRYPGSLDVFVSDESNFVTRCYWRWLARGRARFHRVPGRHLDLLSGESLAALSKVLSEILGSVEAGSRK